MSKAPVEERVLAEVFKHATSAKTLAPGPRTTSSTPKVALRRCCTAWQRAFDAHMEEHAKNPAAAEIFAARDAGEAYCNAMPMLAGSEGVRDFIACVAHGILIGAIHREKSSQLIYAAQVALSSIQREPKPPKTPQNNQTLPPSPQNVALSEGSLNGNNL